MITEEEKIQEIKQAFFEYAKENELSAFNTPYYFQNKFFQIIILPEKKSNRRFDRIRNYGND
jgi:hypothetical protein